MTVICAINTKSGTWIGSDSRTMGFRAHDCVRKWSLGHGWAVGAAGHLRTINLLEANADTLLKGLKDAFEFALRARNLLRDDGYRLPKEDESGPAELGQYMVLANGRGVWQIGCDFSIVRHRRNDFVSDGSGGEIAAGAYFALGPKVKPEVGMRTAIQAAIRFDAGCGGRIFLRKLPA